MFYFPSIKSEVMQSFHNSSSSAADMFAKSANKSQVQLWNIRVYLSYFLTHFNQKYSSLESSHRNKYFLEVLWILRKSFFLRPATKSVIRYVEFHKQFLVKYHLYWRSTHLHQIFKNGIQSTSTNFFVLTSWGFAF